MSKLSKRQQANLKLVDRQKRYDIESAVVCMKTLGAAGFDEMVDVAIRLGVDAKKSDQMVRGVARLPHGTGRAVRILVFARGDKDAEARAAGADFVGAEDMVEKIKGGWLGFDRAIATPDMMAKVGPIAKILGPRGLLPNPRVGTVTADVGRAVREEKAGRVEFRIDKAGILHVPIGKLSFEPGHLAANFAGLMGQVTTLRPTTAKGNFIQSISVSSTMGPSFRLDLSGVAATVAKG